jgi:circadian clock protein KaiC
MKYRGVQFRDGWHDCRIVRGGMVVYPRLIAAEHVSAEGLPRLPSGVQTLDELFGGGLERGTSTLFTGAPGTGKSSLAAYFAYAAALRGEAAAIFAFDESVNTLVTRTKGLGMDLQACIDDGRLQIRQVDPAELSPGEFVHLVREAVSVQGARVIVIDSLNGYLNAMPDERYLIVQLHELLTYLGQCGVATIMISAHTGIFGSMIQSRVDASYLADALVLFRYFEADGEVRQVISVVKKRGGAHERSIREYRLSSDGLWIGPPLRGYRGVLSGTPVLIETDAPSSNGLMDS